MVKKNGFRGKEMKKRGARFLYRYVLPYVGLFMVRMVALTQRTVIVHPENERRFLDRDKGLIYVSWHQRFFPGITFFARRKPIAIMISQSRDGDLAARLVKILGWEPVRGSSTRGGREALNTLNELALSGYRIGHIVDGPRGPFGVVKPGLLKIAQATGLPMVPTITSGEKNWQLGSWDRFLIPKPFSRVIIRFGEPDDVPADLDEAAFEKTRLRMETRLRELYEETDRIWEDPETVRGLFGGRWRGFRFFANRETR